MQSVSFVVDDRPAHSESWIIVSAVDAQTLMQHLPSEAELTERIAEATSLESAGNRVAVGIGEDTVILDALVRMERRGPLSTELDRLRKGLEVRIAREE